MNSAELEFISEEETISIVPKFSDHRRIHLISGDIGPFRAGIPCVVPIWVALNLRQRQRCTIIAPEWMDVEVLEQKIEEEKSSSLFTEMPSPHYMGIAHLILSIASNDISNADRIRTAVQDLWDIRLSKARSSCDAFLKGGGRHAGIDFLTQLEIATIRPLLLDALDVSHRLSSSKNDHAFLAPSGSQSQNQSASSPSSGTSSGTY